MRKAIEIELCIRNLFVLNAAMASLLLQGQSWTAAHSVQWKEITERSRNNLACMLKYFIETEPACNYRETEMKSKDLKY